jgi:hypothetical protein
MGGRIDDLAVLESNPAVFYVGAATGGLWRTTNNGTTWEVLFDDLDDVVSIGDIAIPSGDANTIWVGSGENNNRQSGLPVNPSIVCRRRRRAECASSRTLFQIRIGQGFCRQPLPCPPSGQSGLEIVVPSSITAGANVSVARHGRQRRKSARTSRSRPITDAHPRKSESRIVVSLPVRASARGRSGRPPGAGWCRVRRRARTGRAAGHARAADEAASPHSRQR